MVAHKKIIDIKQTERITKNRWNCWHCRCCVLHYCCVLPNRLSTFLTSLTSYSKLKTRSGSAFRILNVCACVCLHEFLFSPLIPVALCHGVLFCSALFCFVLMLMLMLRFNKWNWCVIKNTKTKRNPSNQLLFPCSSDSRSGSELTTWSHTNRQITSRENIKTNCSSNPKHQHQQQQKWQ